MTLREAVYMCMDEVKLNSDDSFFTEDHVVFLLGKYRSLVLKKEMEKENKALSSSNTQTICLNLIPYTDSEDPCGETVLKSEGKLPDLINDKAIVYPVEYFAGDRIIYTSMERFRFATYNRMTRVLIYAAKGPDNYLYVKSGNPQFMYLRQVTVKGVFENFIEAAKHSCKESEDTSCDIMDTEFPLENALVPTVIELVVKELTGYKYQPRDTRNNASDDASVLQQTAKEVQKGE